MHFSLRHLFTKCTILMMSPWAYAQSAQAPMEVRVCPVPQFAQLGSKVIIDDPDVIQILSKRSSIEKDQFAIFEGGVTLINKDKKISAQKLEINRNTAVLNAQGNIHFQNDAIDIFAQQLKASESSQSTTLSGTDYHLKGSLGHGKAGELSVSDDGRLTLSDSSFTTCYGETPDWQISASEINISAKDNKGEAFNAVIELFDVPVFYLPYISFPVTDERKSGFLYPVIGSSNKSGLEIETPYYLNIAENMDATITPRYMSKRGTQLLTEFRYLSGEQTGKFDVEYLNKDDEITTNDDARYLWRFQHVGNFSENFRAYADYTSISDDAYLVDIGSKHYNSNDAYLYQIGELAYFGETWNATVKVQDFEVIGNHNQSYKTVPQIEINNYQDLPFWNGKFELYSELSRFKSNDQTQAQADRFHLEAGMSFPIYTPAWFFNSEFKLLQTNYKQERLENSPELERHVSRTLPKVRFHGGINLERETTLFNTAFTQTIEPQLQYLYIPDREQDNIGLYDTTILQDDYAGLFRDKRFSGLDRIAEANQYSWGLTSRLLDKSNVERMRFSLGRIVYLNDTNFEINDNGTNVDESSLAADIFVRANSQWQFSSNIQYNTDLDITRQSQANIDYHFTETDLLQLTHRYTKDLSDVTLEQLSLLSSVRLNKDWHFVSRVTQDLKRRRSLETLAGFQYENCCWGIRFAYQRHINSSIDELGTFNDNRDEFDSGFVVQFVIKGLSGQKTTLNTQDMFNSSIFGYKRPYYLNN
ncbi:LPS-assembly protein LptD [Thalassotalea atypica]|uniref:LPS-assembly protein LptD n=1 Tax=Thalassotalea atypica TaxID=2054316 RepID=UPI0025735DE2|nr:LPS assembly protein LptD [Thalassotalea atypica]